MSDTTTKLKVDLSDFTSKMKQAQQLVKNANAEFKNANDGSKAWAKSIDAMNAKIEQQKKIIEANNLKIKLYKEAIDDVRKNQVNLEKAIEATSNEYEQAKKQYGDNSKEAEKLADKLLKLEIAYRDGKTQISGLTQNMRDSEKAVEKAEKTIENYGKDIEDAGKETKKTKDNVKDLGDGFTVMKGVLANVITEGLTRLVGLLKDVAKESIELAASYKALDSQFAQTFGDMAGEAEEAISRVATSTGILDQRLKGSATKIYAFARSNGADVPKAMDIMERALRASADSAAYYDKSLEETTETMMSFLKGNYANDAALGLSATEATRNAKAFELFGDKYNNLTEIQKQETLLKMVEDSQALSGAVGQASREMDGWENVTGNLNQAWDLFLSKVGGPILEGLIPIVQNITASFKEWMDSVEGQQAIEKLGGIISGLTDNIAELVTPENLGKLIDGFEWVVDNWSTVSTGLASIVAGFTGMKVLSFINSLLGPYIAMSAAKTAALGAEAAAQTAVNTATYAFPGTWIVIAIAAVIAALVLFALKGDEIVEWLVGAWEWLKEKGAELWGALKEGFTAMWDSIVQFFTEKIPEWFAELKAWFDKLPYYLGYIVGQLIGKIVNFGISVWNWITTDLPLIIDGIVEWFKKLPGRIWEWLVETWNKLVEWGGDMIETGREKMEEFVEKVEKAVDELPEKILQAGKDMVTGFVDGVKEKWDWAVGQVKSFFSGVIDGAKEELDSHSPSRVFMQLGEDSVSGYQIPWKKQTQQVRKVVQSALDFNDMKANVNFANSSLANITGGGGRTINFTQNNYSPKSLSRTEIYRQTKNAIFLGGA